MKDFAKSIVCNVKAEVAKVVNVAADITSDGNTWFVTTSDGKKKEFASEREAEEYVKKIKSGNSKVGNGITKFGTGTKVIADGHEAIVLKETVEQGPNGIPFGWVEIKWTEGPWKGQTDTQYDYDLKKKVGNSKVGNSGWIQGTSGNFAWTVLSFDEPSDYGINNGRISKLFIRDKTTTKVEANYDRGWDVRPSEKVKSLYNELIRKYN